MDCQKHLFNLDSDIHYLNCAYKAPLLKSAESACIKALHRSRNPASIKSEDFFSETKKVRTLFAQIVNCHPSNVALIPSTSYGFSSVLNNIEPKKNGHAITIKNEFPSGYFSLKRWCLENSNELLIIEPEADVNIGKSWNQKILEQITEETSIVLISSIHWMNGVKFDLEKIGQQCKQYGAKLIIDGTQSVGACKMDVQAYNIDALVCASYKWLLGPYSVALMYLSEAFKDGKPLEEAWMNRTNAQDFTDLTTYEQDYFKNAGRYNMGQASNLLTMPILREALQQIIHWNPTDIQTYCAQLIAPLELYRNNTNKEYAANHLFALKSPPNTDMNKLRTQLEANKIIISVRGNFLRCSVNVFNDQDDIDKLIMVLKSSTLK